MALLVVRDNHGWEKKWDGEERKEKEKKNKERSKDGEKKKGYEMDDYCKDEMERD